ncbi:hypothetical protein GQ55_1G422300 [Panicum hallii var. hallii]|uniref:Uncharacterized protein n=1 Tax=Panicum hallii var. hallii TaxID=1504633 RepID=A0A2T7FD89_9POAL|nr:hypothetical protein GQ55_1G422300 [Panicum hallii var. hallii]
MGEDKDGGFSFFIVPVLHLLEPDVRTKHSLLNWGLQCNWPYFRSVARGRPKYFNVFN